MEIRPVLDEREACACQMSTENVPMLTACVRVRCARRTHIIISRRILNRLEQDHARRIQLMSIYG